VAGEFVDYERAPGFWFLFEMALAVDICRQPLLSAKYAEYFAYIGGREDIYKTMDEGLQIYEMVNSRKKYTGWY